MQRVLNFAITLAMLSLAESAAADERCPAAAPPRNLSDRLAESAVAAGNPEQYELFRQQQKAQRATYEALLAAGAPEKLACAAALNPDLLRVIAPTYFGRPSR